MPPKELLEAYSNCTVPPSNFVSGAYPIFFEVGIPNLVCGCILGWQCRVPFSGHCDLELDHWLSLNSNHNVRPSVTLLV